MGHTNAPVLADGLLAAILAELYSHLETTMESSHEALERSLTRVVALLGDTDIEGND